MLTFAIGAALVSLILAVSVFTISRGYLVEQRERSAERQTAAHADFIRGRLALPDASIPDMLVDIDPPADTVLLVSWQGRWFTSEPDIGPNALPGQLRAEVAGGRSSTVPTTLRGAPFLAVGIPLEAGAGLYQFSPLEELQSTLGVLSTVLIACAVAATLGGAVLGRWASRRVLQPLHALAATAAQIAAGDLDTRLSDMHDRDLGTIVTSFNRMVDSLQRRIERERRFFGDVSHELRTPLTTLVTSVEILRRREDELPERSRRALDLVTTELRHLRRLLDDLLALARAEAGLHHDQLQPLSLRDLLTHTLAESARPTTLLTVDADSTISGRKLALGRVFLNLMDNADQHGGGLTGVTLRRDAAHAAVLVDDAGPGVPPAERERIFERFATGHTSRDTAGTGLGLALVAETLAAHRGHVSCQDRPGGGARFVVTLPHTGP